jgi:hypothetical protein
MRIPAAMRAGVLVLLVVMAVAGCRGQGAPASPAAAAAATPAVRDLLARVPADTPYLFASLAPDPEAQRTAVARSFEQMLRYLDVLADLAEDDLDELDELDAWLRVLVAAAELHRGHSLSELVTRLGIDPEARLTLYGNGVWPVLRFELADGRALRAAIEEVLAHARVAVPSTSIAGAQVWRVEVPPIGALIIAIERRHATVALAPAEVASAEVLAEPGDALDIGAVVADVSARTGMAPTSFGVVDLRRLAAEIGVLLPARQRACAARVAAVVARAPRLVVAVAPTAVDRLVTRAVIELDDGAHGTLARLQREIPHWPAQRPAAALLDLGIGLDLGGAIRAGADLVEAALGAPACASAGIDAADLAGARAAAGGVLGGISGGAVTIYDLPAADDTGAVEAVVAVATRDAVGLLHAVEAQLGLPLVERLPRPGAPPVELDGGPAAMLGPMWLALTPGSLLVSVGDAGGAAIAAQRLAASRRALLVLRADYARTEYRDALDLHASLTLFVDEPPPPPRLEDFAALGELVVEARLGARALVIDAVQQFQLGR